MPKPGSPLTRVRKICLALPEATEKKAWGAPTFRVRDKKMVAMFMDNHHGDGRVALRLNSADGVQNMLVDADPKRFFVPPYQGPCGWIGVRLDIDVDWDEVSDLVEESYRLPAPKKLVAELDKIG